MSFASITNEPDFHGDKSHEVYILGIFCMGLGQNMPRTKYAQNINFIRCQESLKLQPKGIHYSRIHYSRIHYLNAIEYKNTIKTCQNVASIEKLIYLFRMTSLTVYMLLTRWSADPTMAGRGEVVLGTTERYCIGNFEVSRMSTSGR